MTLALFRVIEADKGLIVIDNVSINKLGLHTLRSKLTILPQVKKIFVLFKCTIVRATCLLSSLALHYLSCVLYFVSRYLRCILERCVCVL